MSAFAAAALPRLRIRRCALIFALLFGVGVWLMEWFWKPFRAAQKKAR